ncbi:HesA/MoeB/ThiF family protein [Desulfovibrio intestinalis]|uniref:Molybdopterin/thiamine biosynthesis adenylyltransferase n=1 Tax=Desulfovibrio intestinalis TaxID=58621 RepID=A0A7W8C147_9BACT|nr:ThiF family adenylyltransferase [Desulfovibrio intestinalis]MBB5143681.1 molybdopterin/thiamine biosynthesis adenylyltransferase [Desulfovibrio intestinalis]
MTTPQLYAFFKPHLCAVYPAHPASADSGRHCDGAEILFVRLAGIRTWADTQGMTLREAMICLLGHHIWPERFRRNYGLFSSGDMACLLQSRVLVLGCGGLGGYVAELLARSGVGSIRLVDNDVFDESNLNRQCFSSERALGLPKARVVCNALEDIASHVAAEALEVEAGEHNLPELVTGMDIALDCLDSIPLKTALERAALARNVPFIHGAVLREEGFSYANSGPRPRLEELYPQGQSSQELAQARREAIGALAPASVACLMVKLTLRALLTQSKDSSLLHLDLSVPELEDFSWTGLE